VTAMKAFSFGLSRSMRVKHSFVTSTGDTFLVRTSWALQSRALKGALALPVRLLALSGCAYLLIGAFKTVHGRRERRQAAESRARMPEEDFEARGVSDGV
jgi:hypothetical protein